MKMTYLMLISTFCFGMIVLTLGTGPAYAQPPFPVPPKGGLPACEANPVLPGDGYENPDAYGLSGHGVALHYTDNDDGTFTDNNTGLMWEEKDNSGGIHDVGNTYSWSSTGTDADGTLFNGTSGGTIGTDFLYTLNNTCAGDDTMYCTSDTDCNGIGNGKCGFAGHQDWRIPNVKELQSIVDYSHNAPAWSAPGEVGTSAFYWSATTEAGSSPNPHFVWIVSFDNGDVGNINKGNFYFARAVRP